MSFELDRPPTLTSVVVDTIRNLILQGELRPGTPMREVELSHLLNVSRGTVREAVLQLEGEGLVERIPHRGVSVARLGSRKAREVFTLRALLEPYAVHTTLENKGYTGDHLDSVRELVRQLSVLEAQGDVYGVLRTDRELHYQICVQCGHQLLLDMLKSIHALNLLYLFSIKLYQSDIVSDAHSHRAILEAILLGDPVDAAETVKKHIEEAGAALLQRMSEVKVEQLEESGK